MSHLDLIEANTEDFIGGEALIERIRAGKKLRVKLGVDPTRPDLTLGHFVVFNKLRQFQDLGHECILLIGDYTATIGDPTGRNETRPVLTQAQVRANAETYLDQAFQVLDEERTLVRYNSEWFQRMTFADCLELARKMTVARMLERDDFSKRFTSQTPISIVEFLYPLVQGYDSVMLKADVELGGSDQLFNMLVGRALQKDHNQPEQAVITMPLLIGLDGTQKMSKSADNFIAFNDTPKEMFGKLMSIDDHNMWDYYRLLLNFDVESIERQKQGHPMTAKKHLASSLVSQFHSLEEARYEMEQFEKVFSKKDRPDAMPHFAWGDLMDATASDGAIVDLMIATQLFSSKKELRRLIEQGGVRIDSVKVDHAQYRLPKPTGPVVIQVGRRQFFEIE